MKARQGQMHKLNFSFDVKSKGTTGIVIAGYANAATDDRANERIDPKGWRLDNYKKNPVVLFDHGLDPAFGSLPIGRARKVEARDGGLYCEVEISNSKTEKITAIRDLVEEGILKTFSVGFDPKNHTKDGDVRVITDSELLEISAVPLPMNQDSTFSLLSKKIGDSRSKTARKWFETYKKNYQAAIVSAVKNKQDNDNLELLAIVVAKSAFDNLEKTKKFLAEKKYLVEKIVEDDNSWKFIQKNGDNDQIIEIDLTPSIKAQVKGGKMKREENQTEEQNEGEKKPEEKPADGEASGEEKPKEKPEDEQVKMDKEEVDAAIAIMHDEALACANNEDGNPASWVADEAAWAKAKEAADQRYSRETPEKYYAVVTWLYLNRFGGSVKQQEKQAPSDDGKSGETKENKSAIPTGADAVDQTTNPQIDLSKQTNVLLGVVIDQLQQLNSAMERFVEIPTRTEEQEPEESEIPQEESEITTEEKQEDDEEMQKCITKIRKNQEDLNLRLKSLIN
jgi:HK97 family phage prohead protease